MTTDLFPKPPRRMRQPPKDVLREQLALAADALIAERERAEYWLAVAVYARGPSAQTWPGATVVDPSPAPGTFTLIDTPRAPWWRRIFRRAA